MFIKIKYILLFIFLQLSVLGNAQDIHVSKSGDDSNTGSAISPLLTINAAAQRAVPGNTVLVHEGEYRELVKPLRGGTSELNRIIYKAADGEYVVIKGSESVLSWTKYTDLGI